MKYRILISAPLYNNGKDYISMPFTSIEAALEELRSISLILNKSAPMYWSAAIELVRE